MKHLLALDPGGTTGWSYWSFDALTPLTLITYGQVAGGVDGFAAWAARFDNDFQVDEVVSERFIDDGRTASPNIEALKIEGSIVQLWRGRGVPVTFQSNGFKRHADDLMLKRLGFWFKGAQHSRDSARHAVAYLKVRDHRPTMRMTNPSRRDLTRKEAS